MGYFCVNKSKEYRSHLMKCYYKNEIPYISYGTDLDAGHLVSTLEAGNISIRVEGDLFCSITFPDTYHVPAKKILMYLTKSISKEELIEAAEKIEEKSVSPETQLAPEQANEPISAFTN